MTNHKKNERLHSTTQEVFDKLDQTAIQSEQFFEKHVKKIIYVFLIIILFVLGYFTYNYYFEKPNNLAATEAMEEAEKLFFQDSLKKALNGGGAYYGFEQIIEEYGSTDAGNLAKYYAAIAYYKLKKYDQSITTIESFKPNGDEVLEILKHGILGDGYAQKKEYEKALENYNTAIEKAENLETFFVFYNKKAGILSFENNKIKEANSYFSSILDKYPNSTAKNEIEKYEALTNR
jgi:predicted negative regulator of RcsB-dependent stress response